MIKLGKVNCLQIVKFVDFGLYLDGGDGVEILLPRRYVTDEMKEGDEINVFVYADSEDRLVATTETPKARVGEFAFLQVAAVNNVVAFMDWGLMKDLLVPFREQKVRMEKGRYYVVYVYVDDNSKRIVASAKLDKFLDNKIPSYKPNDEVEIIVTKKTDLGYKVIVDNLFWGMIYHNEIFRDINIGEVHKAYVKNVRSDQKIDLILSSNKGIDRVNIVAGEILDYLKSNNGFMKFSDSSSPEEIKTQFKCSKKDFKKSIGWLLKKGMISIADGGVKLPQ